jgi:hypothetical protein
MKLELEDILKIIDSEEEYEGEMPEILQQAIQTAVYNGDVVDFFVENMRVSVILTKRNIKSKILALASKERCRLN